jgi:hypothetical protein
MAAVRTTRQAVVAFDAAKATPEALTKATADAGFPSSVKALGRHERGRSGFHHHLP